MARPAKATPNHSAKQKTPGEFGRGGGLLRSSQPPLERKREEEPSESSPILMKNGTLS